MEEEDHFTLTQLSALIAALAAAVMTARLLLLQLSLSLYSLHILTTLCTLSSLSPFIQERRVLAATHVQPNKCQPTTTRLSWLKRRGWLMVNEKKC
jgi:hypothetical protein